MAGFMCLKTWPQLTHDEMLGLRGSSYAEIALQRSSSRVAGGEIEDAQLRAMIDEAYADVCPQGGGAAEAAGRKSLARWSCFTGPTLAFKDVAMQLLARLMDHALQRGRQGRATIVGAHIRRYAVVPP